MSRSSYLMCGNFDTEIANHPCHQHPLVPGFFERAELCIIYFNSEKLPNEMLESLQGEEL